MHGHVFFDGFDSELIVHFQPLVFPLFLHESFFGLGIPCGVSFSFVMSGFRREFTRLSGMGMAGIVTNLIHFFLHFFHIRSYPNSVVVQ